MLLPACQSEGPAKTVFGQFGAGQNAAASGVRIVVLSVDDLPSVATAGADDGPQPALATLLARYAADAPPIDRGTLAAWRGCGLRVLAIPRSDVDSLRRALNVVGPVEDRWLGQVTQWSEAAHSPEIALPLTLRMDNGPMTVSAGTLRLLLRDWAAPVLGDKAERGVIQFEMVPDFKPPPPIAGALRDPREPAPDASPIPFWRLHLRAALDGGTALLIVPEDPDVRWEDAPGDGPDSDATPPERPNTHAKSDPSAQSAPAPKSPLGPTPPPAPTLGELLLNRATTGGRRTRTILLLTAEAPAEYRLLQ
ncbi:MAG: hypothetical protein GC200_11435 [Tepidisphaera sp.]|nr:hypothetical protein [Tepidisphaera sp.]